MKSVLWRLHKNNGSLFFVFTLSCYTKNRYEKENVVFSGLIYLFYSVKGAIWFLEALMENPLRV